MRKYYDEPTIERTTWTSKPALQKMILATAGNIAYPEKIEKVDDVQKTFCQVWAKRNRLNEICR